MANNMQQTSSSRAPRGAETLLALATGLVLAGCGGGGGGGGGAAVPAAPQSVAAFPGDTEVTLTWGPIAGALSYTVYWDTTPNLAIATANAIPNATPPFSHQGLANGTDYYYRVSATNGAGEGSASSEAWARPRLPLGAYDPSWASTPPTRIVSLPYDPARTVAENAADLLAAIAALVPGDRLELTTGTWVIDSAFSIDLIGTAAAPIETVPPNPPGPTVRESGWRSRRPQERKIAGNARLGRPRPSPAVRRRKPASAEAVARPPPAVSSRRRRAGPGRPPPQSSTPKTRAWCGNFGLISDWRWDPRRLSPKTRRFSWDCGSRPGSSPGRGCGCCARRSKYR